MGNTTAMSTPQDEVDALMMQVADEHGLEMNHALPDAMGIPTPQMATPAQKDDDLTDRLAALKARA